MSCKTEKNKDYYLNHFYGPTCCDDVKNEWEKLFTVINSNGIIKVISDYSNADLAVTPDDIKTYLDFIKKNQKYFSKIILAQVLDNSKIAFPMLLNDEKQIFCSKAFSTLNAAEQWILQTDV